jgi:hypothetical protein
MLLYMGITHPLDTDQEEKIEEGIQEWFQEQKTRWEMAGVLPYDPVLREIAIDIGSQSPHQVIESLRAWLATKLELDDSDYVLSDHSTLEDLTVPERTEHLRHKLLYLLGSIRRLNHTLGSGRLRQFEYLLGGVATEAADLLPNPTSVAMEQPPLEEGWSRQLDDFWKNL